MRLPQVQRVKTTRVFGFAIMWDRQHRCLEVCLGPWHWDIYPRWQPWRKRPVVR